MADTFDTKDSTTWLSSLIGTGADAMTNLYYVDFTAGVADDDKEKFTVRLSSISGLPTFSHKTETKKFMTVDFDAPVNDFDFEKKLTLEFRLDQGYDLYTKLMNIMGKTSRPSLGYATTRIALRSGTYDDSENNLSLTVKVPKNIPDENSSAGWNDGAGNTGFSDLYTFTYCWISKVSGLESFSYDSASARTVKAEVYYYGWTGPLF